MTKKYAGIGSRKTPSNILTTMSNVAIVLARRGWLLRSGAADGADSAFESGCDLASGDKEIWLPWPGFNANASELVIGADHAWAFSLMEKRYEWMIKAKSSVRNLIARNMIQILGPKGNEPVDMVFYWAWDIPTKSSGTSYAVTLADSLKIPLVDLSTERGADFANKLMIGV